MKLRTGEMDAVREIASLLKKKGFSYDQDFKVLKGVKKELKKLTPSEREAYCGETEKAGLP